jgi:hypothetical protein
MMAFRNQDAETTSVSESVLQAHSPNVEQALSFFVRVLCKLLKKKRMSL